jgi:hypothetical protein
MGAVQIPVERNVGRPEKRIRSASDGGKNHDRLSALLPRHDLYHIFHGTCVFN